MSEADDGGLSWEFPNAGKGKFAAGEGSDYYEARGREGGGRAGMSIFRRCLTKDISELKIFGKDDDLAEATDLN